MITTRFLGLQPYQPVWEEMKQFTCTRTKESPDELWLLEHPAVYTQGQAGRAEHILQARDIPIIQTDRGGQVTYHGPGQLVAYVLMDIQRRHLGIRTFVCQLERLLIDLLHQFQITAHSRSGAPGVYVGEKKIASLGLRVKNGCTYHGIALNVSMDLSPFSGINPCGYKAMQMTQIKAFIEDIHIETVSHRLAHDFVTRFDINDVDQSNPAN